MSGSEAWGVSGTTRGRGATPGWGAKTVVQDWSVVQEPSLQLPKGRSNANAQQE